ncbi:unnamed protein product [Rhodiola kirilowii]
MYAATFSYFLVAAFSSDSDSVSGSFSLKKPIITGSHISMKAAKAPSNFKCKAVANNPVSLSEPNKLADAAIVLTRKPVRVADTFTHWEQMIQKGLVSREEFQIKSYQTNADMIISCDTILKLLQEAAINHISTTGVFGGTGFAQTPEMSAQNLSWVVTKLQIVFDDYPMWGDVIEVDTWCTQSGRNGLRINSIVRDRTTSKILIRASSCYVIMSRISRRFCKIPDEIKAELQPCFFDCSPFQFEDSTKTQKLNYDSSDYVHKGLKPKWTDLDFNLHVNNVKYMDWILESTPETLLQSHSISSMTLDYRRECGADNTLDSLTAVYATTDTNNSTFMSAAVNCHHLLQLEDGAEVLRGRTMWRPKRPT